MKFGLQERVRDALGSSYCTRGLHFSEVNTELERARQSQRVTLGTRGFLILVCGGSRLRLDRHQKPRMKSLWYQGYQCVRNETQTKFFSRGHNLETSFLKIKRLLVNSRTTLVNSPNTVIKISSFPLGERSDRLFFSYL